MITSRVSSKGRTTMPKPVRAALGLKAGETIAYVIEHDRVIVKRVATAADHLFATFGEWAGEADRKAYDGL